MSDTYDDVMAPKTSDDLGLRIDAVQDLIRLLVIAPASQSDDELPRTPATLLHLSQRLGRLLAQAGMTDCVRAAATLERATLTCPLMKVSAILTRCSCICARVCSMSRCRARLSSLAPRLTPAPGH